MNRFTGMAYDEIMEILLEECEIEEFDPEDADVFDNKVDHMVDIAQNGTIEMAPRVYNNGSADITAPIWEDNVEETDILVYPAGEGFNAVYWLDYEKYIENPGKWDIYDENLLKSAKAHIRRERLKTCTIRTGSGKYRYK